MTAKQWLFSFYGRIGRGRWWAGIAATLTGIVATILVLSLISEIIAWMLGADPLIYVVISNLGYIIGICAMVLFVYVYTTLSVKRLHDIGFSGWWIILPHVLLFMGAGMLVNASRTSGAFDQGTATVLWLFGLVLMVGPALCLGSLPGKAETIRQGADPRTVDQSDDGRAVSRGGEPGASPSSRQGQADSFSADLRDLQKLLEDGLISQEDYEAKKKHILGI